MPSSEALPALPQPYSHTPDHARSQESLRRSRQPGVEESVITPSMLAPTMLNRASIIPSAEHSLSRGAEPTVSRTLEGVEVDAADIDDCFEM